ncbi:beta-lactamase/transpeptidase-like protein [Aspergillus avenaceus]|uniref:Beta-lactamase/transpeptidase-like protein n=1 Tax=Aspergillus avenaceus TaxID=36643 RepID=A0A5N6TTV8_ASPAV|nr:beta-lactamase/transpeptidase-like protein [Aspergillus avenaceus]
MAFYSPTMEPLLDQKVRGAMIAEIEELQRIGGTAGVSIGIMSHGSLVFEHHLGFADVENKQVANANTRYPLGLLSRSFVAAIVAQLVQEGKLKWDEPITTYIEELDSADVPMPANYLTLTDLLSERTGVASLEGIWLGAGNESNIHKDFTIAMCKVLPVTCYSGCAWLPNDWMYALAAEIIERVTKLSWGEALEAYVLRPLNLSDTSVKPDGTPPHSTALPYAVGTDGEPVRLNDVGLLDGDLMSPACGIRSTLSDCLAWGNLFAKTFHAEPTPLHGLSKILENHCNVKMDDCDNTGYGMGFARVHLPANLGLTGINPSLVDKMPPIGHCWIPYTDPIFYQTTVIPGYNHAIFVVPEAQMTIVVLTNSVSRGDTADWIAQAMLQTIHFYVYPGDLLTYAAEAARTFTSSYSRMSHTLHDEKSWTLPEISYSELTGVYRHGTKALSINVFQKDGLLQFNINGKPSQTHILRHHNNDTFDFFPSEEDRIKRSLMLYTLDYFFLTFQRNEEGYAHAVEWCVDSSFPYGQIFEKVTDLVLAS